MNLGIVGSRTFSNYSLLKQFVNKFRTNFEISNIVSGGAIGADSLGAKYADENNISKIIHPAEWDKYGKAAGYRRNKLIVNDSDTVVAFWDGESRGTAYTIDLCENTNTDIIIYNYKTNNIEFKKGIRKE